MIPRGGAEALGDRLMIVALGCVLVFAVGPLVVLAVFSVNDFPFYSLPFRGVTGRWYTELVQDARIHESFLISVRIGTQTALVATVLGTTFSLGIARMTTRRLTMFFSLGILPIVTPALVLAMGSQVLFVQAGIPLSQGTVVIAQTTAFAPFVVLFVSARLAGFDWNLAAAARDLGAGPGRTFLHVVLPLIWPAVRAGLLVAFLLSFNEFVIAFFTGRGVTPLPALIYSMQRVGVSPTLLAYSTTVVVAAAGVVLALRSVVLAITGRRGTLDGGG